MQLLDALLHALGNCRVKDLGRLSLQDPEYVSVHADAKSATPQRLKQFYITCPLHSKLDLLWFFIKTHLKKRTIVFFSTCKQVRSALCRFRVALLVQYMAVHGSASNVGTGKS
jgi:ATP-dependent RNA helicase DDX10/DBP4